MPNLLFIGTQNVNKPINLVCSKNPSLPRKS